MEPSEAARRTVAALPAGAVVVAAVSGGADSVAMLHLLVRARAETAADVRIVAAHLDHGQRGAGSRADAGFVRETASGLAVPCRIARAASLAPGASEAACRRVRYRFLRRVARQTESGLVVTAHTLDDQAETVLDRLLRGAGPRGLRGILPERRLGRDRDLRLARPLLSVRRSALRTWLEDQGLPWREDPTNRDGANRRARLRLDVLPAIERLRPGGVEALARAADRARESWDLVRSEARRRWASATRAEDGATALSRDALRRAPAAVRWPLLERLLREAGQRPGGLGETSIREALRIATDGRAGARYERPGRVAFRIGPSTLRPIPPPPPRRRSP